MASRYQEESTKDSFLEDFNLRRETVWEEHRAAEDAQDLSDIPKYRYNPFEKTQSQNHIRLLTLLPSGQNGQGLIECNLTIVVLDENTDYEALSYCWGDAKDKRLVSIRLPEGRFHIQINRNLHAALKHLRLPDKPRVLWIDAVCINQDDLLERNQQVAMMRDIYRCSAHTLIWLGEAVVGSSAALDLVSQIGRVVVEGKRLATSPKVFSNDSNERLGLPLITEIVWFHLFDFFSREWFNRVWIIQELALSRSATVLCGEKTLPWNTLEAACLYILQAQLYHRVLGHDPDKLSRCGALSIQRDDLQKDRRHTVFNLLLDHCHAQATDPRDYVFALNGLFQPGSFDEMVTRPDYQLDCAAVYTKVATDLLQQQQSLDILSISHAMEDPSFGKIPSWVPDWSNQADQASCLLTDFHHLNIAVDSRPNYKASGDSLFQVQWDGTGLKLLLKGYLIDTIDEISTVMKMTSDSQATAHDEGANLMALLRNMIEHAKVMHSAHKVGLPRTHNKTYPTGEERTDAFWQTLVAGNATGNFMDSKAAFQRIHRRYRQMRILQLLRLNRPKLVLPLLILGILLLNICHCGSARWTKRVLQSKVSDDQFALDMSASTHRRVVKTRAGLIGLAPPSVEKGDLITLCNGGKLPVVLRAQGDGFRVIGDAYVHGLTDGRAWDMLEGVAQRSGSMWDAMRPDVQRKEFWVS